MLHTLSGENTPESNLDKLRSIVATYLYRHMIQGWKIEGIDFSMYMYIPEIDNVTGMEHHERSDHGHLLKRIASHTRELRYPCLSNAAFTNAMRNPNTGLTHAALVGLRKQSVRDAERVLSYHVARYLEQNNFPVEATYVRTIAGWHEATDGRGLKELERCHLNYTMLNHIVQDWIPYYDTIPDFSMADINRSMDNIRGFSRETFVEVTTNIESQEHRRRTSSIPEHPRAGTTDDNETFFAMCHRYLGENFTLRELKYRWQKICKRIYEKNGQ